MIFYDIIKLLSNDLNRIISTRTNIKNKYHENVTENFRISHCEFGYFYSISSNTTKKQNTNQTKDKRSREDVMVDLKSQDEKLNKLAQDKKDAINKAQQQSNQDNNKNKQEQQTKQPQTSTPIKKHNPNPTQPEKN